MDVDPTMLKALLLGPITFLAFDLSAQGFPWERPLLMAWSSDGITFDPSTVFQDSSGVPLVVRWKGDTLIATFQWFRQPDPSPSWDRVAVKFSYDNGLSWTVPTPILVNGLPLSYQRPFDPTLAALGGDSLRIYFSSSDGIPPLGLDSTVNTYSAVSVDGIHYQFEPGARVDVVGNRAIDPAVVQFGPGWHYLSPAGAPQDGAYHYVSPNGINFNAVPMVPSDAMHNWTGNYMLEGPSELRFYGAGQNGIWYNSSPNGGVWNGYVSTNIQGGDPSVLKVDPSTYLIIYVGAPYALAVNDELTGASGPRVVPVPAHDVLQVMGISAVRNYRIRSLTGALLQEGTPMGGVIRIDGLSTGAHLLEIIDVNGRSTMLPIVKE
ncbi:MAG: hypothetical protein IPG10_17050 [Flavobacteriales bacterium]|nr:hypothetical protein [Flavobacteriales bacterium]